MSSGDEFWTLFYFLAHSELPVITTLNHTEYQRLVDGQSVAKEGDEFLLVHTNKERSELTIRHARGGVWRLIRRASYARN